MFNFPPAPPLSWFNKDNRLDRGMKQVPPPKTLRYRKSYHLVLPTDQLQPGMYVAELDRPWEETPFLFQGFLLESEEDVEAVREHCNTVTIDIQSSVEYTMEARKRGAAKTATKTRVNKTHTVEQALPRAQTTYDTSQQLMRSIMDDVRLGKSVNTAAAREAVSETVDCVLENSDAMSLLTRLRDKDEYTTQHSLSVSILSIALGRTMGMQREQLNELGMCALLHDVGKVLTPDQILNKPSALTPDEFAIMKGHTTDGRDILMSSDGVAMGALDVAHSHHERLNGTGYPRGLKQHQLTNYTKLVAVTDTFDAMTSERVYKLGQTNMASFKILTQGRGSLWDADLVFQFIETVGIYPPGTVVELSSGETAVVLETHQKLKLRPKILIVRDPHDPTAEMRVLDLAKVPHDRHGQRLYVSQVLHAKKAGVDLNALRDLGVLSSL